MATLLDLTADDWSAIATWCAVFLAAVAGLVARGQLREAQRLRREQAQPYVVAYIEPDRPGSAVIELVIKNFGATAAFDVRLDMDPAFASTIKDLTPMPASIPTLVPGQAWRTLWDVSFRRYEQKLPSEHRATVTFRDSSGRDHELKCAVDWTPLYSSEVATVYGPHEIADALRTISKSVKSWTEGTHGLAVTVRDGEAKDERARQRRAERLRDAAGDE